MKFVSAPFEIKRVSAETGEIVGYGAVFGNVDLHEDVIKPGAFTRTLAEHRSRGTKVAMLWAHDMSAPIGAWSELQEDERGLLVKGKLSLGVAKAREALELLQDGAVNGLSIGFRPKETKRERDVRVIEDLELFEVSLVAIPANHAARAAVVKHASEIRTVRDFERTLRDVGFTSRQAKKIAAAGFNAAPDDRDDPDRADPFTLAAIIREHAAKILRSENGSGHRTEDRS